MTEMTSMEPRAELDTRFSAPEASPNTWADVQGVLEGAELFWVSTVRADGRPHVTPLTAVWRHGVVYFCTGAGEQKGVNLARHQNCVLTTGSNTWKSGLDVVIEGEARLVTDEARLRDLARAWESKYR